MARCILRARNAEQWLATLRLFRLPGATPAVEVVHLTHCLLPAWVMHRELLMLTQIGLVCVIDIVVADMLEGLMLGQLRLHLFSFNQFRCKS